MNNKVVLLFQTNVFVDSDDAGRKTNSSFVFEDSHTGLLYCMYEWTFPMENKV